MTLSKRKMVISTIVNILSFIIGVFVFFAVHEWIYGN
jgi:hypothetical protein